jgi:hypothetical protein
MLAGVLSVGLGMAVVSANESAGVAIIGLGGFGPFGMGASTFNRLVSRMVRRLFHDRGGWVRHLVRSMLLGLQLQRPGASLRALEVKRL